MTQSVTPQVRCTNWQRTRQFYEDGLGFRVQWTHRFEPNFPVFARVARGPLTLFLTEHAGDCQVGGAAYIIVDDVDAYFNKILARGVEVREPPGDSPWETREMLVVDPRQGLQLAQTSRNFAFDIPLAFSCREQGAVLVSANTKDMARIRRVFAFDSITPYPRAPR